jgi:hypothetical protein
MALHVVAGPLASAEHVTADGNRRRQVLLNLLSNAVKYNRPAGHVTVSAARAIPGGFVPRWLTPGSASSQSIWPTCSPPVNCPVPSSPRSRAPTWACRSPGGLVEAMGGTIGVDSRPGEGTTFVIDLSATQLPDHHLELTPAGHARGIDVVKRLRAHYPTCPSLF